ncbi:hypothetical protein BS50DRAFT_574559 [Corynespora cassiicola Philippines]|uniref:Uncharacterized protein n=1 Tax=Corynespora cassiicola Philippines TaxID=1448308 RepID=A0A2T2NL63_CORCC|nr:hypothetical protein BS50DRAFT_574559 [Corynespora cassiicola Philippines]
MPTKSQSPGPNPTSSAPKVARSRKAAISQSEQTTTGRAGSAGGIVLSKEQPAKAMSPANPANAPSPPPLANDAAAASATAGPNRQRRRPRKLNREPASTPATDSTKSTSTPAKDTAVPSAAELEALKSRVRGLEAKVEELYNNGAVDRSGRSPRRRGKGRKNSGQQIPTTSSVTGTGRVEELEEADEELVRLEGELEVARRDLDTYRQPRPRTKRSQSSETDFVEEIPRGGVGYEDTTGSEDRQVTLTGNYRIPLPANVSMNDVKNIQSGVTAAHNVARSFLEQRRAQQAAQSPKVGPTKTATSKTATSKTKPAAGSTAVSTEAGGQQSWSEWFGGYSMAISRAVSKIEAEAAIESQRARPTAGPRRSSAPGAKSTSGTAKTAAKAGTQRPPLKQRQGNLSSEQVNGLMG